MKMRAGRHAASEWRLSVRQGAGREREENDVLRFQSDAGIVSVPACSRSAGNGACVEVAFTADAVAVRDSKDPAGAVLWFGTDAWREFVSSVRTGVLDH